MQLYVIQDRRNRLWMPTDWETTLRLVRMYRRQVLCVYHAGQRD